MPFEREDDKKNQIKYKNNILILFYFVFYVVQIFVWFFFTYIHSYICLLINCGNWTNGKLVAFIVIPYSYYIAYRIQNMENHILTNLITIH